MCACVRACACAPTKRGDKNNKEEEEGGGEEERQAEASRAVCTPKVWRGLDALDKACQVDDAVGEEEEHGDNGGNDVDGADKEDKLHKEPAHEHGCNRVAVALLGQEDAHP